MRLGLLPREHLLRPSSFTLKAAGSPCVATRDSESQTKRLITRFNYTTANCARTQSKHGAKGHNRDNRGRDENSRRFSGRFPSSFPGQSRSARQMLARGGAISVSARPDVAPALELKFGERDGELNLTVKHRLDLS